MQMKTKKLISIGKTLAIAIIILGVIHDAATYSPLIKGGLSCLDPGNLKAMIYMSLMCGTSLILSGIILFLLINKVELYPFLSLPLLVTGIFLVINGILSVIYMSDNPFAWIALVLNLSMFVIIVVLKMKTKSQ